MHLFKDIGIRLGSLQIPSPTCRAAAKSARLGLTSQGAEKNDSGTSLTFQYGGLHDWNRGVGGIL